MVGPKTTQQISPGQSWLMLSQEERESNLTGLISGLNQGLRHCADEVSFALTTRLPDNLNPEARFVIDTVTHKMRTWSKAEITVFKYSRPITYYIHSLCEFYERYPQFCDLTPAYLMIFLDDNHGMTPDELYSLHEHSLHGSKR